MSFEEVAKYEDVLDGTMKHIEIGQKESWPVNQFQC